MISYKEFIDLMEGRGYVLANNIKNIYEISTEVKTFSIKKGSIGKILEIECPNNIIIGICGKNQLEINNNERSYYCNIKCFDENGKEPFQDFHRCITLTSDRHTIIDIVITKVMQKGVDKNDEDTQKSLKLLNPILNLIESKDPNEYVTWTGNYKILYRDFINDNFNLYGGDKIIFYAIKPDIDIDRVTLDMKVDILEKLQVAQPLKPLSL